MRKNLITMFALTAALGLATTAQAGVGVQNTNTDAQRKELEKRLSDLERQQAELRRQLDEMGGGSPRVRVQTRTPRPDVNVWGTMPGMTMIMGRPKFGFTSESVADSGARINAVTPGSPAEKAGLKTGDLLTMFNGIRLAGKENPVEEIMNQARDIEVGDTITAEYRRGAERKTITMVAANLGTGYAYTYGDSNDHFMVAPRASVEFPQLLEKIRGGWLNVELVGLNKELGDYFGTTEGVLVVRAPRDSSLGLKSGDVILSIGGRTATSPSQIMRVLGSYEPSETFEIQVMRQKKRITVNAKVPNRDRGFFWEQKEPGDHGPRYHVEQ